MKRIMSIIFIISLVQITLAQQGTIVITNKNNSTITVPVETIQEIDLNKVSGTPCAGTPTVNYAGKTYNTVQIGSQCWLKENLDVGTMIRGTSDQTNNGTIEKYCYNNITDSCTKYGGLYQWVEAVQYKNGVTNSISPNPPFSGNVQGICPNGWHIPTRTEFETLRTVVNNSGPALLVVGQGIGTNTSGFSALLAGFRYVDGSFNLLDYCTTFWSSSECDSGTAYYMGLFYNGIAVGLSSCHKTDGLSVRCAKD